ncbi:hypothetical protein NQD34_008398 [Periophthalmus magnuspinnatus]|nr:hypothetical protein NQD34_008398 [Periophthalmus magnuspinnatus]
MPCITPNMKLVPRQSQTQEKDRGQNTKATTGSDVVKNIHSNAKAPSEKAADGVQSANQVSCIHKTETMEISVQEKSIEPVQPERQTGEHELPNPSSPCPTEDVSAMERSYCLSDMDISDSGAEKEDSATARSDCGRMLWSYIQKKIREPLIGLSAVYECVHNNDAPIYLCDCCHCVIIEQHIVSHLTQAWHYKNYFAMIEKVSVLPSNNWRKEAVQWERSQGNGEAQIVELTSEEFGKLVSSSMYHEAISIVQKHLDMQEKKSITCVDTTTANSQKTAQQDVEMELDPEPVTAPSKPSLSTKTATNSKSKQDIMVRLQGHEKSITTTTATVSQCLTSTVTIAATAQSPTISSVCLLSSRKFSTNPTDVKNTITDEDASLKMEDKTPTVTPKPSKPLCKFIKARGVNPEAECKTANESIMFVSCTTIDTSKPNFKPICKFITSKSANRDTPAMTHLEPPPNGRKSTTATIPTSLNDTDDMTPNTQTAASSIAKDPTKETSCSPISDASNACKEAPNLQGVFTIQDKSISFDAMHKCKADSMPSEPASKVAPSGNNPLSCCVTTKTLEDHTKSTVNQLKLNINAETHIKKDGSVLKMDSLTPTTPNCDPQTWTTEASEKATTTNCPKVGLDQLLKVTCKESTHTYCFACLLILEKSNHLTSTAHQINCVKAKYPSWSGKPNETKLSDMVAQMAHDEKAQKITCKQIEVPPNVYKELKSLPDNLAIEKVKGMIEKKSSKKPSQRQPSAATRDMSSSPCSSPSSPCVSVSPCDVTSPGLGVENGKTKPLAKCNAEPIKILPISTSKIVQKPTSKVTPRILKGSTTDRSNLIRILGVMGRPVIGLSFVWECRVVPPKLPTFYLCESCHLTISVHEICGHMASAEHRRKYIMRQYPRFMYWIEEDLLPEMIDELMNDIAGWVWCREELMDAQTVLLSEECFERVRTAPFSEALHMVRRIKQTKTTALPLIVTSQHDVENQVEMLEDSRATDLDHTLHSIAGNSAESPTVSDNMPSPHITQLLLSPAQSPASAKQPDDILLCSAFNQNMSMSAKDEKKELLESVNEASANIPTPLSQLHNSKILITELSQNLLQQIPQNDQSISFVNQNLSSPKTKNQEHCEPLNKVGGDVSSPLSHDSAVGTPAPIDSGTTSPLTALKDTSINAKHETGIEDYMALEDAPQNSSGLTGESVSAIATSITDHNNAKSLALDSNVQNEVDMFQMLINLIKQNKNAANVEVSCTADSSESNVKKCQALQSTRWDTRSLPDTDTVPKEDSILNEDMTGTRVLIPKNNYLASGNGAPTSKENTEKPAVSSDLCKDVLKMMSSEMTVIQQSQNDLQETQVKTEETEIHEVKNKTKVQAPNEEDQPKELNIGAIDAKIQQSQVQTSQQNKPQLTSNTQMVPSQSPNQQRPICSLVSNRPKKNFKRENDYRQNISIMNANVQDSQGPSNTAATATVSAYPSNTMQVTGGYGHFDHTGYPTNTGCHSNMAVQNVHYSYSNAYLSQVYHHQQQAQYYTSMQPSIQNVQNPEVMEWFNPNTPLQPGAQTYAAVAGTNNVADLNTDTFNTANQNGTPTGWSY